MAIRMCYQWLWLCGNDIEINKNILIEAKAKHSSLRATKYLVLCFCYL